MKINAHDGVNGMGSWRSGHSLGPPVFGRASLGYTCRARPGEVPGRCSDSERDLVVLTRPPKSGYKIRAKRGPTVNGHRPSAIDQRSPRSHHPSQHSGGKKYVLLRSADPILLQFGSSGLDSFCHYPQVTAAFVVEYCGLPTSLRVTMAMTAVLARKEFANV
jgi:hypothetical protein